MILYASLNPRFDGAFLNSNKANKSPCIRGLNPRFDGAFLNCGNSEQITTEKSLNPRFDGAFLNYKFVSIAQIIKVS